MNKEQRRILFPYMFLILLDYIGFAMPLPIMPGMFLGPHSSFLPDSSYTEKMINLGLLMASFPLGEFFGSPILGRFSDRYGRKKVVLIALLGSTLANLITAYAVHIESLVLMHFSFLFWGFCEGNDTIVMSVIDDLTREKQQALEKAIQFGRFNIFISVGFVIGPLMGGVLADPTIVSWFTLSTPFLASAIMTLLATGYIFWKAKETLKEKSVDRTPFFRALKAGFKQTKIMRFFLANFFLAISYFAYLRFFPVFLQQKFHFDAAWLSYIMCYDSIAIAIGVLWLVPHLAKRWPVMRTLRLFSLLLSIAIIISFLPPTPYALLLTLPPVGICMAVVITNGALLISDSVSHRMQGLALGTLTSVEVLAEIFTGLIGGPLAASFYELPLYVGAGMAGICFLILILSIWNGNNKAKLNRG